jgi:hypothetical protein
MSEETWYEKVKRETGERRLASPEGKQMLNNLRKAVERSKEIQKEKDKQKELEKKHSTIKLFKE